jgi:hypothetical protein
MGGPGDSHMPVFDSTNVAPIAMFVFNRLSHTRQTVEALQRNELAGASDLFAFSDGPRSPADADKVRAVREYLRSITGFRKVTVIERERNLGCARSIISGITEIVNKYGQIIVVEDDIVTAPHFLRYMNEALELYRNEQKVACIHGYLYPVEGNLPETFFIRGADIWGWATWKRAWDLYEPDAGKLLKELKARGLTKIFNFDGSYNFTKMLKAQMDGLIDTWDVQWYASALLHDKLTLYPGRSLVQNIGFDSSGTHCNTENFCDVEISQGPIKLERIAISENSHARKAIGKFLESTGISFWKRIINNLFKKIYSSFGKG